MRRNVSVMTREIRIRRVSRSAGDAKVRTGYVYLKLDPTFTRWV